MDVFTVARATSSPPIIAVVGWSNSGKTTLLEKLIAELDHRGLRVGVIKHHHTHDWEMDRPGKDTWRFRQAGAQAVALATPSGFGLLRQAPAELPLTEFVERYFHNLDLVFTEGYKREKVPKIEVRGHLRLEALPGIEADRIALVTDAGVDSSLKCPCFRFTQLAELSDYIVGQFLPKPAGNRAAGKPGQP